MSETTNHVPLKLGSHVFREFTGADAVFGANERDYPKYADIPEAMRRWSGVYHDAASGLFYKGGKLEDFGLELKPDTDRAAFFTTLRALLSSWAPSHEVKMGTVSWLLSEYTRPLSKASGKEA